MKTSTDHKQGIDWGLTLIPLTIIAGISCMLLLFPKQSERMLGALREIFVNRMGFFYIILGLGVFLSAIGLAVSRKGNIRFGDLEKPRYGNFSWGAMIFTSTMAADILYWSLIEWCYYYSEASRVIEDATLAQKQDFASAYPLFHWGPIPWAFYLLPACAYAYMMFVKKRKRQTLSEACRPLLGKRADARTGKLIDIFAIVGLLAGTATTFSLATPLLAGAAAKLFGISSTPALSALFLVIIGLVFMAAVLTGMKAISHLASACVIVFCILLGIFLAFGPKVYLIETGITAIGNVADQFFHMATWMDPLRASGSGGSGFPQNWTIFYWAYWISWFVATPFFIARISEGRTLRQTVFGGLSCGLLGTYTSFIVFGGFGLHLQTSGTADLAAALEKGEAAEQVILRIFDYIPVREVALAVLILAMIAFYASTFDAITFVVAGYSEKSLKGGGEPRRGLRAFWSLVFLILPVALLFSESTLAMLQTVSILAAFPLGVIMICILLSFWKELKQKK